MRSAAAAIGTAPASLYRYVATRDELVELMADQVYGEFSYRRAQLGASSCRPARARSAGPCHVPPAPVAARRSRRREPARAERGRVHRARAGRAGRNRPDRSRPSWRRSACSPVPCGCSRRPRSASSEPGQDTAQWQGSLAGYLVQIAAARPAPAPGGRARGPALPGRAALPGRLPAAAGDPVRPRDEPHPDRPPPGRPRNAPRPPRLTPLITVSSRVVRTRRGGRRRPFVPVAGPARRPAARERA